MAVEALTELPAVVFETAAEHATTRVPIAAPGDRVEEIRRSLEGRRFDTAQAVAICEGDRLVGLLRLEDLLAAAGHVTALEVMDPDPPVASPGMDQERVAWKAVQHDESTLAVVGSEGEFVGFVPAPRMLAVLLWEHEEDMARLGGFLHNAASARRASREPVARRYWHRLPWLLVGLAGAALAAWIVGSFEEQLAENVAIAFFVPGIVYLADAIGTQTETLVIRGLSVGVPIGQVVRRELLTGCLVGVTLALVFLPVALLGWGEVEVALAATVALFAASFTATVVAMTLPAILHRLGRDPAFGSGPLATVVQDLLSILIYFALVLLLVR